MVNVFYSKSIRFLHVVMSCCVYSFLIFAFYICTVSAMEILHSGCVDFRPLEVLPKIVVDRIKDRVTTYRITTRHQDKNGQGFEILYAENGFLLQYSEWPHGAFISFFTNGIPMYYFDMTNGTSINEVICWNSRGEKVSSARYLYPEKFATGRGTLNYVKPIVESVQRISPTEIVVEPTAIGVPTGVSNLPIALADKVLYAAHLKGNVCVRNERGDGFDIVRYDDSSIHWYAEYTNNVFSGIWVLFFHGGGIELLVDSNGNWRTEKKWNDCGELVATADYDMGRVSDIGLEVAVPENLALSIGK